MKNKALIVAIAEFTTLDSLGGLTLAIFDTPTAQALLGKSGRFDEILVAAKQGGSLCDAEYYVGLERILRGDKAAARPLIAEAAASCPPNTVERALALGEKARLAQ